VRVDGVFVDLMNQIRARKMVAVPIFQAGRGSIKCRGRIYPTRGLDESSPYNDVGPLRV